MPMSENAPISWVIERVTEIVTTGAGTVAGAVSAGVAPIASACFGIYVIMMMWGYMRGTVDDPIQDFFVRMCSWAVIIGFGLNSGNYASTVIPIVTHLGTDLAAFVGGSPTSTALDELAILYIDVMSDGFDNATSIEGMVNFPATFMYALKSLIIILTLVPFLVAAAASVLAAKVGSVIIAMVGPIFFACLLFPATRQYFSAWLNAVISYAFVPMLIAVVANISVGICREMIGTDIEAATFAQVVKAGIGNLLLLYLLQQVSSLASSLSAGGINMGNSASGAALGASVKAAKLSGAAGIATGKGAIKGAAATYNYAKSKIGNSIRKAG